MFDFLEGRVVEVREESVVIAVNGVGYELFVSETTRKELASQDSVRLFSILIFREPHLELFGFASPQERTLFRQLTSVSGVGPKMALSLLGLGSPTEIIRAIGSEDVALLTSIPGIGPKVAKRIITELKDRLASREEYLHEETFPLQEVLDALTALGYRKKEVLPVVRTIQQTHPTATVEEALKYALQDLSR